MRSSKYEVDDLFCSSLIPITCYQIPSAKSALQGRNIIACGEAQRNHRKTNRSDGFSHRWDDFNRSVPGMNRMNPVPTITEVIATGYYFST